MRKICLLPFLMMCLMAFTGCESTYYDAMEQVGIHKRDILVDRIEAVQKAQENGQEQFTSALEQFQALVKVDGGALEDTYKRLDKEYQASEQAAKTISDRVNKVESVAEALFKEWQKELEQYNNPRLKADSQSKLNETRLEYNQLLRTMRKAEQSINPVLNIFKDNVLYLKHNLNARAISSLRGELSTINNEVDDLIRAMQQSINESDDFIQQIK